MRSVAVAVAAGASMMVVAWYRASDTLRVDDQVRWASVGLAGAVLVSGAGVVAASLVHRRMQRRFGSLRAGLEPCLASIAAGSAPVPAGCQVGDHPAFLAAPNMIHYHRPDCLLAAGKPARAALRAEHERAGRRICAVCEP